MCVGLLPITCGVLGLKRCADCCRLGAPALMPGCISLSSNCRKSRAATSNSWLQPSSTVRLPFKLRWTSRSCLMSRTWQPAGRTLTHSSSIAVHSITWSLPASRSSTTVRLQPQTVNIRQRLQICSVSMQRSWLQQRRLMLQSWLRPFGDSSHLLGTWDLVLWDLCQ